LSAGENTTITPIGDTHLEISTDLDELTTAVAGKQDEIGVGNPAVVHQKLLNDNVLLSLSAGENTTLTRVGDTHLEISSIGGGVTWVSETDDGDHTISTGAGALVILQDDDTPGVAFLGDGTVQFLDDVDVAGTLATAGPIAVGDSLRFGTSLATSCMISSTSGSLLTRVANTALLQNSEGASICESTGSDKSTVFFGGVSAPILQVPVLLSDTITAIATSTLTVASNLQVENTPSVTGDAYAEKSRLRLFKLLLSRATLCDRT